MSRAREILRERTSEELLEYWHRRSEYPKDTVDAVYAILHERGVSPDASETVPAQSATAATRLIGTLQVVLGLALLGFAAYLYSLNLRQPVSHFAGPVLVAIAIAPAGAGFVVSGLALTYRWPAWQALQLAPWLALAFTLKWLRSLS